LPALRERTEDIPLLAKAFLDESASACGRGPMSIDQQLMEHFMRQSWPGNVRQLRNMIFSMVVMAERDVLGIADLPADYTDTGGRLAAAPALSSTQDLGAIERTHILATLESHAGNRTHAAAALRISVRTLQRKLKAWGLENYLHREVA
jgi:DNA-binding NtrC family response regulator